MPVFEVDFHPAAEAIGLNGLRENHLIHVGKISDGVGRKNSRRNLAGGKHFQQLRVGFIYFGPNRQGVLLSLTLAEFRERRVAGNEGRFGSQSFVLFHTPRELGGRLRVDDNLVIVSHRPGGFDGHSLHAFDGLAGSSGHAQTGQDKPPQRVALAGIQDANHRRVVLADAGDADGVAADFLEFGHHARIQESGHDVAGRFLVGVGRRLAADGGQRIFVRCALEHGEDGFNLPARAAELRIHQCPGRHQLGRIKIGQFIQNRPGLFHHLGLSRVTRHQFFQDHPGGRFVFELQVAHALPIQGLGDLVGRRGTVFDDLIVGFDGRINVALDLFGVEALLQQFAGGGAGGGVAGYGQGCEQQAQHDGFECFHG